MGVAEIWRNEHQRCTLSGQKCPACGNVYFAVRSCCECGTQFEITPPTSRLKTEKDTPPKEITYAQR